MMLRRLRLRLLPLALLFAAGVLVSRVAGLVGGDGQPAAHLSLVAPAAAAGGGGQGGKARAKSEEVATPATAPTSAAAPTENAEPSFSAAEIEVLRQLRQRREALDARERELAEREALLHAATQRIDQRVNELIALKADIERLLKANEAANEEKLLSLVRIYENMKPPEAARIFEELDLPTLLAVVQRMKERKLAPILAEMKPAKARDVTVELARLKALLSEGESAGDPPRRHQEPPAATPSAGERAGQG